MLAAPNTLACVTHHLAENRSSYIGGKNGLAPNCADAVIAMNTIKSLACNHDEMILKHFRGGLSGYCPKLLFLNVSAWVYCCYLPISRSQGTHQAMQFVPHVFYSCKEGRKCFFNWVMTMFFVCYSWVVTVLLGLKPEIGTVCFIPRSKYSWPGMRVKCILYTFGYIILGRNARLYFDVKLKLIPLPLNNYRFHVSWNRLISLVCRFCHFSMLLH